ncbi:MAG: GreA/GreB family elongation factor [Rhizobiaceae bacterium]|nr:GreA/GreB family elongation factor [Rhizobiaceae bacterium]
MCRMSNAVVVCGADVAKLTRLAHDLVDRLDPLGPLLLRKLERADVHEADKVAASSVSLDSFATYRLLDSDRTERRRLILPQDSMWPPAELSVASPLGIALLGVSARDRVRVEGTGMQEPPWVEVLNVEG